MNAQANGASAWHVDRAEALRYLGYTGQDITPDLNERLKTLFARCEQTSNPGFTYRIFPCDSAHGDIRLAGTTLVLEGRDIYEHLKDARLVAVMAATAGLGNACRLRTAWMLPSTDPPDPHWWKAWAMPATHASWKMPAGAACGATGASAPGTATCPLTYSRQ